MTVKDALDDLIKSEKTGDDYREGPLDNNPDFDKSFLEMSDKHWEKNDSTFYQMMMKHRKANASK